MITKENYSTEIDRLRKLGAIDDVAINIKQELEAMMPYYDDVKDIKDLVDSALDLLNENAKLNSEDKNIDISNNGAKNDNNRRAHALLLKMRMSRAKLDGIGATGSRSRRIGRRRR